MRDLCRDSQAIFQAGVDAVRGEMLMRDSVSVDPQHLTLGEICVDRGSFDRIILIGAGKASGAMTVGFVKQIRDCERQWGRKLAPVEILGHVNVPQGCESIPEDIDWPDNLTLCAARPAGVNEPTEEAIRGTDRILALVREAGPRDLVVMLLSGGGSALLCRPVAGITLAEKLAVIQRLSGGGANITELNTVRKHLSEVKGGGLARARRGGEMVTMVLSDVLGDPLDLIASGPTVTDTSTREDALQVLAKFDPERSLPESIYKTLKSPTSSPNDEIEYPITVVGNNAVAVDAAGIQAESLGYNHVMQSARESEGPAEEVGVHLAEMTIEMLRRDQRQHRQDALITGGEPVVQLADASIRGKGGRNQQLVLAAYQRLLESNLSDAEWQRLVILSGGSDGEDGPTDAAGAYIDGEVHMRALQRGLSPQPFLDRNDAYRFFEQTGGLVITGPTGTNVCDIRVALVESTSPTSA
ncbi:glycerate kinase type-2 family protein [Aporhodopirellula aestuarii]|uniref:DUF4147 domain-containing protein n=1 Tax=Aporhodopirellula aestuarii TaxID=2950107 RepID=A0ABT0U4F8_9BACT|nr:DUF4147 domain-containing protein [Aporhodopirellula aestuarii]MCM2371747.1 DUF4147 domain-containing protein [Aporhodopirellula aestuarii]